MGLINKAAKWLVRKGIDSMGGGFQGLPAYWFARAIEGGGQESLSEPYKNSTWVQRAIKKVAGPVSSIQVAFLDCRGGEASGLKAMANGKAPMARGKKVKVWTRKGMVKRSESDFVELPDVASWLEQPAKGLAWSDFVEASIGWLKLKGECFWLLSDEMMAPFPEARAGRATGAGNKGFAQIIVARTDRMRHVVEGGELVGWVFTDGGGKVHHLTPDQVIQVKFWNPYDNGRGLAEYDAAAMASEGDWLAGKFSRNLMANNGDTGPYIVAKNGVPADPQREQIIADLKAKRSAQLRGDFRPIFMTGDISVEDPQVKSVDGNFIAQRLENRHEIAAAFGVPMSMFDVKNDFSLGSQSAYYQLILDTCIPTGAKLCDALENLVERLTGQRYEIGLLWDEHPVLQAVRRERFDAMEKLANRGMPIKDASDYLSLDLPRFEGDDIGYLPMSLTPMTEAMEPTPAPATNPLLSEVGGSAPGNVKDGKDGKNERPPYYDPQQEDDANPVQAMIKALRERKGSQAGAGRKAMARAKRQRIWEGHMKRRAATVKMFEGKINRVLIEFRAKALRQLASHGGTKALDGAAEAPTTVQKSVIDFVFNAQAFGEQLKLVLNPVMTMALQTAADQVRQDELGIDAWKFPPQKAGEYVLSRDQAIMKCGQTVRDQINTALNEGYENRETMEELSDRVRAEFNQLSKGQAKRVAMTETGMAFNFSRHESMTAAGVEYKTWLCSGGPNIRPEHQEAEDRYAEGGESGPIAMDEPFEVGGELLMYPGDDDGSAGNVINCQCVQLAVVQPPEDE